jgi:dihydropteroate synthase
MNHLASAATVPPPKAGESWQSPHERPLPVVGARTLVMGILNLTPDSFSDGGELPTTQAVVDRAGAMIAAGADVLDVGGESTRPGAAAVDESAELERVLPAIDAVRRAFPAAPLSIDTYKPAVAAAAIEHGADIINDVWGAMHSMSAARRSELIGEVGAGRIAELPVSPMAAAVARLHCPLILMHNRPDRNYGNFWADVLADLRLSVALAIRAGVPTHQLWLDPGFGFAKEPAQNLEVIRDLARIVDIGYPVLVGASRKSTIGRVLGTTVDDRIEGSGAAAVWAIAQGCAMIRVHDVPTMVRFARMADAIGAGLNFQP